MTTDPVQRAGQISPATNAALEKLKSQIDSNKNGLKGSELINFKQFAQASGISDADIQTFLEANGLAVSKDAKTIRKEDIAEFKADPNRENSSRGVKNNIIDQRQGYMQVALDAFKKAATPEEKAQIMSLVQSMPRTADSRSEFDGKMQTWLGRLENVIGTERLQQSMGAFSERTQENFNATRHDIMDATILLETDIHNTGEDVKRAVATEGEATRAHTSEVGTQVTRDVNRHTSRVGNRIVRTVRDEAAATRAHVTNEHETTRLHVTNEHDATRAHVTAEHEATRTHVSAEHQTTRETVHEDLSGKYGVVEQVTNNQDQNNHLNAARAEIQDILENTVLITDGDVRALGNEATRIVQDSRLSHAQKMMLLQSMADRINDETFVGSEDVTKMRHAHELAAHGQKLPLLDRNIDGEVRPFIDYDNLPELPVQ